MKKTSQKKQQTRQRMLKAVNQSFRRNGYAGIGVDGIAKAAGVTSGAFYAHFGSKDKAFREALDSGLDEVLEALPKIQHEAADNWVQVFAEYYTGQAHRDDLACGCAMATLSPEVVRSGVEMHSVYETKMNSIVDLIATGLEAGDLANRRGRAWAMLGILIGGITMARAVQSETTATEIASATCVNAIRVAGKARAINLNNSVGL